jgi:hypothetical protein
VYRQIPAIVEWGTTNLARKKEVADDAKPAVAKVAAPPKAAAPAPEKAAPEPEKAAPARKSMKVGKLKPKNKSRLPRKQKKAQQKAVGKKRA